MLGIVQAACTPKQRAVGDAALDTSSARSLPRLDGGADSAEESLGQQPVNSYVVRQGPCTFEVGTYLVNLWEHEALPAGVRTVVLVARPAPIAVDDVEDGKLLDMRCNEGEVLAELPRVLFDRAKVRVLDPRKLDPFELGLSLSVRAPTCEPFAVSPCFRTTSGALQPATSMAATSAGYDWLGTRDGALVETPSGPTGIARVERGGIVTGYDVVTGARVETKVLRPLVVPAGRLRRAGFVELAMGERRPVVLPADRKVFLVEARDYRPAGRVAAGDVLLGADGKPVPVSAVRRLAFDADVRMRLYGRPGEAELCSCQGRRGATLPDLSLDVAYPNTYFTNGVLVQDSRPSPRRPDDPVVPLPASQAADVELEPLPGRHSPRFAPEDEHPPIAMLKARLAVRALPAAAARVAIVAVPHHLAPGARQEVDCAASRPLALIDRQLLDAARAAGGPEQHLEVSVDVGKACRLCSVLACVQDANGAFLQPIRRPGRFARVR